MLYIIIMLSLFWRWFSDFETTRMAVDSVYSKDEDSLVLGGKQQTAGMGGPTLANCNGLGHGRQVICADVLKSQDLKWWDFCTNADINSQDLYFLGFSGLVKQ